MVASLSIKHPVHFCIGCFWLYEFKTSIGNISFFIPKTYHLIFPFSYHLIFPFSSQSPILVPSQSPKFVPSKTNHFDQIHSPKFVPSQQPKFVLSYIKQQIKIIKEIYKQNTYTKRAVGVDLREEVHLVHFHCHF